jgi:hypothetical protein
MEHVHYGCGMRTFASLAVALAIGAMPVAASAAPTPVPGGANQVSALSGAVGQTIFNGVLRINVSAVRAATADEIAKFVPTPAQKVLAFSVLLRNGTSSNFIDLVEYTFADKDDISVDVPTADYTHANLNIQQGAAQKQDGVFAVDKDFVPTKLIVKCVTCGAKSAFKTVRISIPNPPQ